jgi:SNF2 family DNA or RNA helicase
MSASLDPAAADAPLLGVREGIQYLDHQVAGVRWMLAREHEAAPVCRGGILGDDMGLGKTFQTIGLLKNSPYKYRTLIVCPPALIAGWTEELRACGYNVATIQGSSAWATALEIEGAETIYLTTYPKACMYKFAIARAAEPFQRIILDEGHIIRNGKATSRWMACMAINKRSKCNWILSATPVQNGADDWRNLCWWLRVRCPAATIPELAPTVMLRRTMDELRADIAALPPLPRYIAHDLSIPEGTKEGKLFRTLCDSLNSVIDSRAVSALIKLELYMRIQQFLVHPQLYIESMRAKFRGAYPRADWSADGGATKWNSAIVTELAAAVADRVGTIVFCNFRREMDMVEAAAVAMGAKVFAVRGGMGSDRVGEAVADARAAVAAGEAVVFVVQIVSGGAGLNLQFCRRILFLSQHWNPAVVHQAVGRAVRIGQGAVVDIHLFRVVDGVMDNLDRRMVQVHLRKISGAREICATLYEGFAPLKEESFPSVHMGVPADAAADAALLRPADLADPEADPEAAEDPV